MATKGVKEVESKMIAANKGSIQNVSNEIFPIFKWGKTVIDTITPANVNKAIIKVAIISAVNYGLIFK